MTHIDGCPQCVLNSEPPRSTVPTENGVRCGYICTDCGYVWTTDYRAETPSGVRVLSVSHETMEAQIEAAPDGASTPLCPGPNRLTRSRLMPRIVPQTTDTQDAPLSGGVG